MMPELVSIAEAKAKRAEAHRRRQAKYVKRNPVAKARSHKLYRDNNPEKVKAVFRTWYDKNFYKFREYNAKRRYKMLRATPKWLTAEQRKSMNELYLEASKMLDGPWHVDHIIPLKHPLVCGLHVPWNLQIITEHENCVKHNKFEVG